MTKIEELREKANRLPLLPGVYIMLDASGEVIYVGKAKALKNRVTSYFRGDHLPKVAAMVSHVNDFNVKLRNAQKFLGEGNRVKVAPFSFPAIDEVRRGNDFFFKVLRDERIGLVKVFVERVKFIPVNERSISA